MATSEGPVDPQGDPGSDEPVRRRDPLLDAARYRMEREVERERAERADAGDGAAGAAESAPPVRRVRADERARWVDTVVDQAVRRGEFDDLPLAGKPIPGLKGSYDPDWWLKGLVEREQITGVLPAAQLREEHRRMEETLDREASEEGVRRVLEDFNARVIDARRQLTGGPPVVTPVRDVDEEVLAWRARRRAMGLPVPPSAAERAAAEERARAEQAGTPAARVRTRHRWWRRA
ncbi:DnaJ family domain-containing protein [Puerhibacterium puerhi]|uniref:DnaJ family domain-containing protein n=1 Tax=Puerhibacterium puerhi TaxID=2692623 RepID=UPI0013598FC2|nr:DUF1992 domain-containing protein [Puerhibacterium puerhi]